MNQINPKVSLKSLKRQKQINTFFHIELDYPTSNSCKKHQHNYSELVIVIEGTALHIIEDQEYNVQKGDVFVIKSDTCHHYLNSKNFRICNICYHDNELLKYENDLRKLPGFQSLFVLEPYFRKKFKFKNIINLNDNKMEFINELIKIMINEYNLQAENTAPKLDSYFRTLIIYLSKQLMNHNEHKNNSDNDNKSQSNSSKMKNLAEIITYIEKNYRDNISIQEIAHKSSYSNRHLTRLFKKLYNTTPNKYIKKLRINHACELLEKTNKNITKVALASGFSNSNYFTRCFKKIKGVTPSVYRKKKKGT